MRQRSLSGEVALLLGSADGILHVRDEGGGGVGALGHDGRLAVVRREEPSENLWQRVHEVVVRLEVLDVVAEGFAREGDDGGFDARLVRELGDGLVSR